MTLYSGSNPTAMPIVRSPSNTSATLFGSLSMIDDPLTEKPELSSKLIGRAQGIYGSAGQEDTALFMAMNFVFLEGKYNDSTISILGEEPCLFQEERDAGDRRQWAFPVRERICSGPILLVSTQRQEMLLLSTTCMSRIIDHVALIFLC
ncbi:hypothetical protein OIU77_026366 [Salix suchowensis]|uniref:Dirigent protein n=1 Tax=Salix suchowensis TaxID=1278906 RepID=A0ABQ9BLB7_9ROSI|nr:hypothetical protein OIU77_026366 [Salix suchowensis]